MLKTRSIKKWFTKPPDFKTCSIQPNERHLFCKAVKLYFFLHHVNHDELPEKWGERFRHSSNVVYSMLRNYMLNGRFDIEYLEFLNDELAGLHHHKDEFPWSIPPDQIEQIELKSKVPITFRDEETAETLDMFYYPDEHICEYRIY